MLVQYWPGSCGAGCIRVWAVPRKVSRWFLPEVRPPHFHSLSGLCPLSSMRTQVPSKHLCHNPLYLCLENVGDTGNPHSTHSSPVTALRRHVGTPQGYLGITAQVQSEGKADPIRRQQVLCHQQDLGFTVPHSALRRRSSRGRGLTLTFLCRSWVKGCVSAETGVVSQTVNGTHSLNTVFFCLPPGAWASFSMLP